MSCLGDVELRAFLAGALDDARIAAVEAHLDGCADCRRRLAEAARPTGVVTDDTQLAATVEGGGPGGDVDGAVPGTQVAGAALRAALSDALAGGPPRVIDDQFRVDRLLGRGGMGAVYLARDLQLDRDVAIKLGHARSGASVQRVQREAVALARLSHPNVVAIHQVGRTDDRLYIAMEYVAAGNAREWAAAAPRSWRDLVALYAAAGDGLAAAHAAGFVHRDFKPDNVLVGADGRPRVADFGLVRGGGTTADDGDAPPSSPALAPMTQTGAVMGTLAYMAPEQLAGDDVDARADQFAFAVALWEALFGVRPFAGRDAAALAAAIRTAEPRRPDGAGRRVPRHVVAALRRALAVDRAHRWPSMVPLVAELRRDPARRWRLAAAGAAIAAVAAGAAALVATQLRRADDSVCDDGARGIAQVWSPVRAAEVRAALIAPGGAWAGPAADRVITALDDVARRWSLRYREVCAASDEALSPALRRRGLECLRASRDQLAAAALVLARPDAHAAVHADAVVAGIDAPDRCADAAYLVHRVAGPTEPRRAAAVRALDRAISVADAEADAGHVTAVAPVLASLAAIGRGLGAPASAGRAGLALGEALTASGKAPALEALRAAYHDAGAAGDDLLAGEIAAQIAQDYAAGKHVDEARDWTEIATTDDARGGDPDHDRAGLNLTAIDVALARHDLSGALTLAEHAVASAPATGKDRRNAVVARARVLVELGQHERALADDQAVLAMREHDLGATHPETIDARVRVAFDLAEIGRDAEVMAMDREIIAIGEASGLPEYRQQVADAYNGLGSALAQLDRPGDAIAALRHAVDAEVAAQGPFGADVASALGNLSLAYAQVGRLDDARAALERAIAIAEDPRDDDLELAATDYGNLAGVDVADDRPTDAEAEARGAIAIYDRIAPSSPDAAYALTLLGEVLVLRGDAADARAPLERAVALREHAELPHRLIAESRGWLAVVLARQGDLAGARALARHVRPDLDPSAVVLVTALDQALGKR